MSFVTVKPFQALFENYIAEDPEVRTTLDLADLTGLDRGTVAYILYGSHDKISVNTADRILCSFDLNEWWHTKPELAEVFEQEKVLLRDRDKKKEPFFASGMALYA